MLPTAKQAESTSVERVSVERERSYLTQARLHAPKNSCDGRSIYHHPRSWDAPISVKKRVTPVKKVWLTKDFFLRYGSN